MKSLKISLAAVLLALEYSGAGATTIINSSTQGLYNAGIGTALDTSGVLDPFPCANINCGDATVSYGSAPDASAAAGVLGNWLTNPAAPGGAWTGLQAIPGEWAVNAETAVIYSFGSALGLDNLSLALGVDNGIFVWLDGAYKFGARAGGGAYLGEYNVDLGSLGAGTHYLQLLLEDHGGLTGYSIDLTGDARTRAGGQTVPLPGSLALMAAGLAAFSLRRRPA